MPVMPAEFLLLYHVTLRKFPKKEILLPIKNGESSYTMVTPYSKKGNYREDHLTLAELNALIKFYGFYGRQCGTCRNRGKIRN